MANPTKTTRVNPIPGLRRLPNGYRTNFVFARQPNVGFWEKTVGGLGTDGGNPIEIWTMLEKQWRIKAPRALLESSDLSIEAAVDPDSMAALDTMVNAPDSCTIWLPDNTARTFYGYLRSWKQKGWTDGEFALIDMVIVQTNYDYVNNLEQGPVDYPAAGT